jgi:hypothetical protein
MALVALGLVGLLVSLEGFQILSVTTDPAFATRETSQLDPVVGAALRAQFEAVAELSRVMQPMGVALLLLGGALTIVSARGVFGRTSVSTLLQLSIATALATVINFVLSGPVRAQAVAAVAVLPNPEALDVARALPIVYALRLALPLITLLLCLFGVTRRAAREFMQPASEQVGDQR